MRLLVRHGARKWPRSDVTQNAEYLLEGFGWSPCQVLDISEKGAGLELLGPWPLSSHDTVFVRLELAPQRGPTTLCGTIQHQRVTASGTLQVGIEYV